MMIKMPYGRRHIRFSFPSNRLLGILQNKQSVRKDIKKLAVDSLDKSLAKEKAESLLSGRKSILVVVPDGTRKAHLKEILPPLLKEFKRRRSCAVDIIVASGLHKKHSAGQLRRIFGSAILKNHKVLGHAPQEKHLVNFGLTKKGIPVFLNKVLNDYDLIISVGTIEPHLYAGYSGGAKTVAIGLAGEPTINATHNIRFLDDPKTAIGVIEDNPFQETLWEIAGNVSIGFCVNMVSDSDGRLLKVFSGRDMREVFEEGVDFCKKVFEVTADAEADIVICGVGYPKDVNLYQASRAINYILNVDRPVLRKGGVMILVAELIDGVGEGISEVRFYNELKTMGSPETFIKRTKRIGCIAGVHRAYMVARPLIDYNILIVSERADGLLKDLPIESFKSIEAALKRADEIAGKDSKAYVVPRALSTIAKRR